MPSVILRIFLALLPNLLAFMSHVQGMTSLSQIDFGVMRKYFIFQVNSHCLVLCDSWLFCFVSTELGV